MRAEVETEENNRSRRKIELWEDEKQQSKRKIKKRVASLVD